MFNSTNVNKNKAPGLVFMTKKKEPCELFTYISTTEAQKLVDHYRCISKAFINNKNKKIKI